MDEPLLMPEFASGLMPELAAAPDPADEHEGLDDDDAPIVPADWGEPPFVAEARTIMAANGSRVHPLSSADGFEDDIEIPEHIAELARSFEGGDYATIFARFPEDGRALPNLHWIHHRELNCGPQHLCCVSALGDSMNSRPDPKSSLVGTSVGPP